MQLSKSLAKKSKEGKEIKIMSIDYKHVVKNLSSSFLMIGSISLFLFVIST